MKGMMTGKSARKILFTSAAAVLLIMAAGMDAAAQPSGPGGEVKIIVYVIEASEGVPGVDPQIRHIVKQFHGTFRHSTYRLVSKVPRKVPMGKEARIALPGLRELRIKALGYETGRIKLKLRISEKSTRGRSHDVLNTEFRLIKGGTIVIGDYNYREGKLILAVSADM